MRSDAAGPWDDVGALGGAMVARVDANPGGYAFTPELGTEIATLYADNMGGGLWGLHHFAPGRIPHPTTIRAWERTHPAFGLLMRQAEKIRAEKLMEEAVTISDNVGEHPARSALRIGTRMKYAGKLDAARYGDGSGALPAQGALTAGDDQPTAPALSDADLTRLALSLEAAGKI